jgi:lipopolysaccharide/colanic/teichoic acid biosynthesis glycosyltransferase
MHLENIAKRIYDFFIYEQERVGHKGRPFKMYKIRTMVHNANELLEDVEDKYGRDARGKIINDPRYTKIGKFLSRYRIDELAQAVNILKGEMTIIGPRAHSSHFYKKYIPPEFRQKRLEAKPGLLKPIMAFSDYDYGNLEFRLDEKYIDDVKKNPSNALRYSVKALLPGRFKWQLDPSGKRFRRFEKEP